MNKYPCLRTVADVIESSQHVSRRMPDGRWVPCRSEGFASLGNRIRCAWLVFTGRADALLWEQQ